MFHDLTFRDVARSAFALYYIVESHWMAMKCGESLKDWFIFNSNFITQNSRMNVDPKQANKNISKHFELITSPYNTNNTCYFHTRMVSQSLQLRCNFRKFSSTSCLVCWIERSSNLHQFQIVLSIEG